MKLIKGSKPELTGIDLIINKQYTWKDILDEAPPITVDSLGQGFARLFNIDEDCKKYVWDATNKRIHKIEIVKKAVE